MKRDHSQIKKHFTFKLGLVTLLSLFLSILLLIQFNSTVFADNVKTRVKISEETVPAEPPEEPPEDDTTSVVEPDDPTQPTDPDGQQDGGDNDPPDSTSNPSDFAPISTIVIPAAFRNTSSRTSDLSQLTNAEAKEFKNLVIEDALFGMIQFGDEIDLSGEGIAQKFAELSKYIRIEKGKVYVDSKNLPQLNKAARVSIYNQNLVPDQFSIYKDDTELDPDEIGLDYATSDKIVSFNVTGFSTYSVKPHLTVETPESIDTKTTEYPIRGVVGDLDSQITINLSDEEGKYTIRPKDDGSFEHIFKLTEGQNEVVILVKFSNGDATIVKQEITYRPQSIIGFAGSIIDGSETYMYVVLSTLLFVLLFFGIEKGRERFIGARHY